MGADIVIKVTSLDFGILKNYLYRQSEIDMKIMKFIIWFGLVIVFLHIEINTFV